MSRRCIHSNFKLPKNLPYHLFKSIIESEKVIPKSYILCIFKFLFEKGYYFIFLPKITLLTSFVTNSKCNNKNLFQFVTPSIPSYLSHNIKNLRDGLPFIWIP